MGDGFSDVVALRNYFLEIAKGNIPNHSSIHKFGLAGDIDTIDDFVNIWDGVDGTLGTGKITNYTFSSTADIDSISSSNNSDIQSIEIHGLDLNWDEVTQTITLNGQTRKALTTNLIRVHRMINVGSLDIVGDVYCYVDGSTTGGVPDAAGDVRAIISNGNNQTEMAIYTIPNGKTGFLSTWYASLAQKTTQISDIELKIRPYGQVFQLKHRAIVEDGGSSHIKHDWVIPEGPILEKSDIILMADTSKNDSAISGGFDVILITNDL